jgi:hypothetical protein
MSNQKIFKYLGLFRFKKNSLSSTASLEFTFEYLVKKNTFQWITLQSNQVN